MSAKITLYLVSLKLVVVTVYGWFVLLHGLCMVLTCLCVFVLLLTPLLLYGRVLTIVGIRENCVGVFVECLEKLRDVSLTIIICTYMYVCLYALILLPWIH